MKKLLKTMLVFIMVAVAVSCSDEEATVAPVKEDNIKTDTKISIEQARQDLLGLLSDLDSERSRSYGKLPRTIKEAHSFKLSGNESRSEEFPISSADGYRDKSKLNKTKDKYENKLLSKR